MKTHGIKPETALIGGLIVAMATFGVLMVVGSYEREALHHEVQGLQAQVQLEKARTNRAQINGALGTCSVTKTAGFTGQGYDTQSAAILGIKSCLADYHKNRSAFIAEWYVDFLANSTEGS